ncbi:MAG TPA: hypothetical protein VIR03_00410 [Candidatus Saccharimonadales bacterium]
MGRHGNYSEQSATIQFGPAMRYLEDIEAVALPDGAALQIALGERALSPFAVRQRGDCGARQRLLAGLWLPDQGDDLPYALVDVRNQKNRSCGLITRVSPDAVSAEIVAVLRPGVAASIGSADSGSDATDLGPWTTQFMLSEQDGCITVSHSGVGQTVVAAATSDRLTNKHHLAANWAGPFGQVLDLCWPSGASTEPY